MKKMSRTIVFGNELPGIQFRLLRGFLKGPSANESFVHKTGE
jgi:hypothetical protein